jgi:hypothetical protein
MNNAVFRNVTQCLSCKYRRFEESITSIIRVRRVRDLRTKLVTANVLPSSLILFTLVMEATRSFETSVFAKTTLRNTPGRHSSWSSP